MLCHTSSWDQKEFVRESRAWPAFLQKVQQVSAADGNALSVELPVKGLSFIANALPPENISPVSWAQVIANALLLCT